MWTDISVRKEVIPDKLNGDALWDYREGGSYAVFQDGRPAGTCLDLLEEKKLNELELVPIEHGDDLRNRRAICIKVPKWPYIRPGTPVTISDGDERGVWLHYKLAESGSALKASNFLIFKEKCP